MTYEARYQNGQVLFDQPIDIVEGAKLRVEVVDLPNKTGEELSTILLRHAGKGQDLPADLATQHDHYAHGKPKS